MSDESRSFWSLVGNGQQPDSNGFIKIDTTKLTSSSYLFNESLHPNSSSYHASPFGQYLHQDPTDFGSVGGLVQNLQCRLNTWVQTSPTVLGFSQEILRSGNIADEYRLQALEAGEHILEEVQKDAVQIFEKTSAIVSSKAREFVVAHPELAGQVDELKHQVTEAADQVTEEMSKTLNSVGLKTLSMMYDGLRIAYDRSDQMTTEFPGRWKLFAGEMAERTLQVREAVKDAASKAAMSLRDQSTSTQVAPGGGIIAPTPYGASSTAAIVAQSSQLHEGVFEGNVIAEAGAIVRSGAGRSFQATAQRYGFNSKVQFDAWKTGEMVDYSQELGKKSDRWCRITGTNSWVSGAVIDSSLSSLPTQNKPHKATATPTAVITDYTHENFTGTVMPNVGARLRVGVHLTDDISAISQHNTKLNFDGWKIGDNVGGNDKWFHVAGTNNWVSGALIDGLPREEIKKDTSNPSSIEPRHIKITFNYASDSKTSSFFNKDRKVVLENAAKDWESLIEMGENGVSELKINISANIIERNKDGETIYAETSNLGSVGGNLGVKENIVSNKARMIFNQEIRFSTGDLNKEEVDLLTVAKHEIGHALGIGTISYVAQKVRPEWEQRIYMEGFVSPLTLKEINDRGVLQTVLDSIGGKDLRQNRNESEIRDDVMYKSTGPGERRNLIGKPDLAYLSRLGYKVSGL